MAIKNFKGKQWLTTGLKLLVAVGFLTFLVKTGKFDPSALGKINRLEVWLTGIFVFNLALMVNTLRWQFLLRFEQVHLGYWDAYALSLIGIFFNFVIPGGVGGDVVKAGYLFKRYPRQRWFIGWTTLVDRIFGMLSMLIYAGTMGLLFYKNLAPEVRFSVYTFGLLIWLGLGCGILVLLFAPREKIRSLIESHELTKKVVGPLLYFISQPRKLIFPMVLSFTGQLLMIGVILILGAFLGADIPWYIYYLLVPLGFLTMVAPIAPAGLGVGQAAFYYLFETVSGNGELGVLAITFYQAVQLIIGCFGGLLFVLYKKETKGPADG